MSKSLKFSLVATWLSILNALFLGLGVCWMMCSLSGVVVRVSFLLG